MSYGPSFRLDGRIALVTGASDGLGRHIALALAEAGADVAVAARRGDLLEAVAHEVEGLGRRAVALACDVNQVAEARRMVGDVVARLGGVDLLVNNAGTNIPRPALEITEDDWDTVVDLDLRAAFFVAQAVGRRLVEQGRGGRIVNMASQMAAVGGVNRAAYCAAKGGLVQLTRVLALEWAEHGIRVNAVGPTFIDTAMVRRVLADDPEMAAKAIERIPIGRYGRPEEVAAAVLYLCSDGADLVTGHHLLIDGGWTAQ